MGWWKINGCNGGIDWEAPCTIGNLVNAIPGTSTPENHYNGDEPADLVGFTINAMLKRCKITKRKLPVMISEEQLTQVLLGNLEDYVIAKKTIELRRQMWAKLRRIYKKTWRREMYPEEVEAVVRFPVGGLYCD